MEILGIDWGWVGNECGPDRRIGHGYDRSLGKYSWTEAMRAAMCLRCMSTSSTPRA